MVPIAAALQAGSGILKGGIGIWQNIKANKALKKLQYANMSIPTAIEENKKQAEIDASVGMPQEQYNRAINNIRSNQINSLMAGNNSRTGIGLIAAINDSANDATAQLDAADAAARAANKRNLQGVNSEYGQWQQKVWQNNVKDKYDRDYNYNMGLKGAGWQNIIGGVDRLGVAGTSLLDGDAKTTDTPESVKPVLEKPNGIYNKNLDLRTPSPAATMNPKFKMPSYNWKPY